MREYAPRSGPELPDGGLSGTTFAGTPFFLARGGLRRLGDAICGSADGSADGFLGYSSREIFWRDALELVHEEDLPVARALISWAKENPGSSERAELRLRDASGGWRRVAAVVSNVLEAPGDAGLVVADLHA